MPTFQLARVGPVILRHLRAFICQITCLNDTTFTCSQTLVTPSMRLLSAPSELASGYI